MSTSISIASDHGGYELSHFDESFSSISFIDLALHQQTLLLPMFADIMQPYFKSKI